MEIWKDVIAPGLERMQVSSLGRMRSKDHSRRGVSKAGKEYFYQQKGREIKLKPSNHGYVHYTTRKNNFRVHRLIWEAFHGPIPPGLFINHKDCNRVNNELSNLEVVTRKRNMEHAVEMGRFPRERMVRHGPDKWVPAKKRNETQ